MARRLFINENLNQEIEEFVFSILEKPSAEFRNLIQKKLLEKALGELVRDLPEDFKTESLFLIGSAARELLTPYSDLDFLYLGEAKEAQKLNDILRRRFRNYSLKTAGTLAQAIEQADDKGLFSLNSIYNLNLSRVENLKDKVPAQRLLDFIAGPEKEAKRPGALKFNIKYSPGGLIDLLHASFIKNKNFEKEKDFLLKVRVVNQLLYQSDIFQVDHINKVYQSAFTKEFKEELDFLNSLYKTLWKNYHNKKKQDTDELLNKIYTSISVDLSSAEAKEYKNLHDKVVGVVSSPSYHVWAVGEHLFQCAHEVIHFYSQYKEELELSEEDLEELVWSALFHDIKKGEKESHSTLGAKEVQVFGKKHEWEPDKIERVSWLVREHLTLVRFAFKSDPFEPAFLRELSLKGCIGKKAKLLFVLSLADIKATNPQSLNTWKITMLKTALDQIIGKENSMKEDLKKEFSKNQQVVKVLDLLTARELSFVPIEIIREDFNFFDKELTYYEQGDKIWIRLFKAEDKKGLALEFLYKLTYAGAYIHHALFKTLNNGNVYNWFCIECGVGLEAFKKRLEVFKGKSDYQKHNFSEKSFSKIDKTYSVKNYAVISFKGKDKRGLLLEALNLLNHYGFNIEWGHALTWGQKIEDVFGVSFSEDSVDWKFLTEK